MSDDKALIEEAGRSENDWVRARILKQDPPAEGSLLKIAMRARDMAANSLGTQHSAYAVSLQNLGLYYDAIENDTSKANEFFTEARAVLKENDLPLAYGFYWLGIFHNQVGHDAKRAESPLSEALAIQRRGLGSKVRAEAGRLPPPAPVRERRVRLPSLRSRRGPRALHTRCGTVGRGDCVGV